MANVPAIGSRISLQRYSQPVFPRTETAEVSDDRYVLSLPLCHGGVKLQCEGGTIYDGAVRPGMLRVASPGECLQVERRSRAEALVVSIPGPLFRRVAADRDFFGHRSSLAYVAPIVDPNPQVERLTSALLGYPEIDESQRPLFLEGVTMALLALAFAPRRATRARLGLSESALLRCIDFAEANLGEKVDLATWAAALDLPSGEFVRRFQHTTQAAPYTWFLNLRIDRAKLLLQNPDVDLAQVAFRVGFSSQSHFSEAFRRRTGISPGKWRKRLGKESRQAGES